MCLTLSNAATVLDHLSSVPPARAYTRTLHHAGHLSPGDLWCAVDGEYPRTAILVHRHHDRITLTDQYGATFAYPAAAVIHTAVPDALPPARQNPDGPPAHPWNGSMTSPDRPTRGGGCLWCLAVDGGDPQCVGGPWSVPRRLRPGRSPRQ